MRCSHCRHFRPAIGPTIGGYLTENYGWQTIFFVNTVPSVVMVIALWFTLEREPMHLGLLKEGDWVGIVDDGDRALGTADACSKRATRTTGSLRPSSSASRSLRPCPRRLHRHRADVSKSRSCNLRLLQRRNFAIGIVANVLRRLRAVRHCLSSCRNISARCSVTMPSRSANVLAWTGLPQLVLIPFVPLLMKRFDMRYIAALGIALFAAAAS